MLQLLNIDTDLFTPSVYIYLNTGLLVYTSPSRALLIIFPPLLANRSRYCEGLVLRRCSLDWGQTFNVTDVTLSNSRGRRLHVTGSNCRV